MADVAQPATGYECGVHHLLLASPAGGGTIPQNGDTAVAAVAVAAAPAATFLVSSFAEICVAVDNSPIEPGSAVVGYA